MLSPNQEYLRRGNKIAGFVIHMTEGSFKSGVEWCLNVKSQVSYHFIIDSDGSDVCLVMPENTAWHAGKITNPRTDFVKNGPNPNLYSIGIAMAGFASQGPTASQIAKCARLMNMLSVYYNIPLDKKTIIPHHDIRTDKICPGLKVSIDTLVYLSSLPQ